MTDVVFPDNLVNLNALEQLLRNEALATIQGMPELLLHLNAIERVMTLVKILVEYPADNEDFKVIKMLSIRMFNAFGASLNLMLSGYHQNSALIMRDTLETFFLMDFFRTNHSAIEHWRLADKKTQREEFSPVAVRKFLVPMN